MDFISAPGNVGGQFTDGDPGAGQPATVVDSIWLNGLQNELVKLISDTGITPDAAKDTQVREALRRWISSENQYFNSGLALTDGRQLEMPGPGEGETVACGWFLSSTGITMTSIFNGPDGLVLAGSGSAGDFVELEGYDTTNRGQQRGGNIGLAPLPEKYYTSALRVSSLAADGSVVVNVEQFRGSTVDAYYTFTELDQSTAQVGGPADVRALSAMRWKLLNTAGSGQPDVPIAPKYRFTLGASGNFRILLQGFGLFEGVIPDAFIPSNLVSDYVKDQSRYVAAYRDTVDTAIVYQQVVGWAEPQGVGPYTNSFFNVWVPLKRPLTFVPTFPETRVYAVSGTVGGEALTTINSAQVQLASLSSNSPGLRILINADHGDVGIDKLHPFLLDFSLQIRKGADFT